MNFTLMRKFMTITGSQTEVFRRNKFNPEKDTLVIETSDGDVFNFEYIEMPISGLDERLERALEVIDILKEVNDSGPVTVEEYIAICNSENSIYETDYLNECDFYNHSSLGEWANELVNDVGELPYGLPEYIKNHINWEGVAEDLLVDYKHCQLNDGSFLIWREE